MEQKLEKKVCLPTPAPTVDDVAHAVIAALESGVASADILRAIEMAKEGGARLPRGPVACLAEQPLMKPGYQDSQGFYRNSFGRAGKELHSEIYLKRNVIRDLEQYARSILPASCHESNNYVVTDSNVEGIADQVVSGIRACGLKCGKVVVPAELADGSGETSTEPFKTSAVFHQCVDQILEQGINKNSCIISVGGGVVNNLCGVIAGMLYRGITLVHFTTTTMGMLDAALDFKQAFNHGCGKNLLGCYYPAASIVIDPEVCATLSTRHVRNGIAEALKHGFTQSAAMVSKIADPVSKGGMSMLHDGQYLTSICKHCIEIKTPTLDNYACSDFNEMCPQYGHAIGHAMEHLSWHGEHSPLLHGEAVAIGMCVSAEIARSRGLCDDATVECHYSTMRAVGLPSCVPSTMCVEDILREMTYDKHYVKLPTMGLCSSVGVMAPAGENTFAHTIQLEEIERALAVSVSKRRTAE